ncbi:hypothetical protein F5Y04DRAFT_223380 [Hypomontagnella monticulosa]|nr:hypothetical protein F5Y04DRAFT_223380 [Hypomontagnella monticulosa]
MAPPSGSRGPDQESSWATVAKSQAKETPRGNAGVPSGKVTFKPKAHKGGNKGGQHPQASRQAPRQPTPPSPQGQAKPTFRAQLLEQAHAAEKPTAQKPEPVSQVATMGKDADIINTLNANINTLKATVSTLNDDLSRRSNDLIQVKTALEDKDSEIEALKKKVAMLEQSIESVTVASRAAKDKSGAKDNQIMELQLENADLRDAIHTGILSVARLYGPGSERAFVYFADQETKSIQETTQRLANEHQDGRHEVNYHGVPSSQQKGSGNSHQNSCHEAVHSQTTQPSVPVAPLPSRSSPSPKKDNAANQKQTITDTTTSQTTERKKENDPAKNISKPIKGATSPPTKVDHPTKSDPGVAGTQRPEKHVVQSAEEANRPSKQVEHCTSEHVEPVGESTGTAQEVVRSSDSDYSTIDSNEDSHQSAQGSEVEKSSPKLDTTVESHAIPTQSAEVTPAEKNDPKSPTTPEQKGDSATPGNKTAGAIDHVNVPPITDTKYSFKAEESIDVMAGGMAPPPKPLPHLRGIDEKGGANHSRARRPTAVMNAAGNLLGVLDPDEAEGSPSTQQSPLAAPVGDEAGENASQPNEEGGGWQAVQTKTKIRKAKNKAEKKLKAKESAAASNNAKTQKPKPHGTVIGSKSTFSKPPKDQKKEGDAASKKSDGQRTPPRSQDPNAHRGPDKGKSPGVKQQEKAGSKGSQSKQPVGKKGQQQAKPTTAAPKIPKSEPPVPRSWADEVEENEASGRKLGSSFD